MSKGKGSSEQMLDLIDLGGIKQINEIINDKKIVISHHDNWNPKSRNLNIEVQLNTFLRYNFSKELSDELVSWWLIEGTKMPVWDFISTYHHKDKKGIILIEAKSHVDEFDTYAKKLDKNASKNSNANHNKIKEAIKVAKESIKHQANISTDISIDKCYQLSNRITQSWWLASHGIPVLLVYLGFIGDKSMADSYKIFNDKKEWDDNVNNYFGKVKCEELIDKDIQTNSAPFKIITKVAKTYQGKHL